MCGIMIHAQVFCIVVVICTMIHGYHTLAIGQPDDTSMPDNTNGPTDVSTQDTTTLGYVREEGTVDGEDVNVAAEDEPGEAGEQKEEEIDMEEEEKEEQERQEEEQEEDSDPTVIEIDVVTEAPPKPTPPPPTRCECKILQQDGSTLHDFGNLTIRAYDVIKTQSTPDVFQCHKAHQQCRTECNAMLELNRINQMRHRNGMEYCRKLGRITPPHDIVRLHAQWRTVDGGCKKSVPQISYHTVRLCCGITYIDINAYQHTPVSVFAWDIDCKGLNFVYGP